MSILKEEFEGITNKDLQNNIKSKVINTRKLISEMLNNSYKYNMLSKGEESQIILQLGNLDLENDWFSRGTEGAVFKLTIKDESGAIKDFLIAKKRYDNDCSNELHIHKRIQDLLQNSHISDGLIGVPELKAFLSVGDDSFIIMEFIQGKTLYQIQIEKILEKHGMLFGVIENDSVAESMLFNFLSLNSVNLEDRKKASNFYYNELKSMKIFSLEEGKKYKDALTDFFKLIHGDGLYHRDGSNPRNIIFGDNGRVYVIDFGRSVDVKGLDISEKDIYERQEGEMMGYYPKDEELLIEISTLTKTHDDMLFEKEVLAQKERRLNIEKGQSIFEIMSSIPGSRSKNKNMVEDVLLLAKKISESSKYIKLLDLEEAKTKKNIMVLLLAQSYENIGPLLDSIINKKKLLLENKSKEEMLKHNIPSYVLKKGDEAITEYLKPLDKKLGAIDKKIKFWGDIEQMVLDLKSYVV